MELVTWGQGAGHFAGRLLTSMSTTEPQRDKTNKMTYAPSEDSDRPEHPSSLMRVYAEEASGSYLERTAKILIRLGECPG